MGTCKSSTGCNSTQGLICNMTEQTPYKCKCTSFNYWNSSSQSCQNEKLINEECSSSTECLSYSGLYCNIGLTNTCICKSDYYWSSSTRSCGK